MVRQSKKPIIYAGGGIISSGAAPHLKAFAERTGIPVALTLLGLGGFPSEHFLCLQMLGMHGTVYANYAINEADLLLALGVRFDDRVTGKVERVRQARQDRPHRHRPVGDQQEQGRPPADRRRRESRLARPEYDAGRGRRPPAPRTGQFADWMRQIEALARGGAAALRRPRRRHPAAVRHPAALADPQGPRPARRHDRHDGRRPASDVGGAVFPLQPAAALGHQRRPRHDGLRPAVGDGRPGGPPAARRSSTSTATAVS